ncbi:MAG: pyruvate kinase, partial [Planctomycetaceae bacterium]|nr:pyruvate kinase [Planctomycetaceae bacterium]
PALVPWIVAKIEKPEAVDDLDAILNETDVVMVARGDLGVEVDIVEVPVLQKRIIAACNRARVPVITATQMLESMIQNELPTRAEATDVANAVLDGTDAVMLSGETAIGRHPARAVTTMSRITREAAQVLVSRSELPLGLTTRTTATELTIAVTRAAIQAAERLQARLLVLVTRSGITAAAVSELRSPVPILALTDSARSASLLTLTWGVLPLVTDISRQSPQDVIAFVEQWNRDRSLLQSGDRLVMVGTTDWSQPGKDLMLVHALR